MTLSYYSSTSSPQQDMSGYVMQPSPCRQCGQELQGLHEAHRCPGCGLPVGRSIHPGILRFAPPAWLGIVRSGLLLEFWAIIIGVTIGLLAFGGAMVWFFSQAQNTQQSPDFELMITASPVISIGLAISGLVFQIILAYGIWQITSPEPEPGASPHNKTYGPLTRMLTIAALVWGAIVAGIDVSRLLDDQVIALAMLVSVSGLLTAGQFLALVLFLSELGAQIPDRQLASRTRTLAWSGGIALMLIAVMSVLVVVMIGNPDDPAAFGTGPQNGFLVASCFNGIVGLFVLVCYIMFLVTLMQLAGRFRQAKDYAQSILLQPFATSPVPAQQINPTGEAAGPPSVAE